MKLKISNSATDFQKLPIYAFYLADCAALVSLIVLIIKRIFFAVPFIAGLFILMLIATLILFNYTSKLCDAYLDDEYLYLKNGIKKDKVELSNIKSLNYHSFFIRLNTESVIVVKFYKETVFGEKIYIYPTSLNEKKEYKSNRQILNLITEKTNNYKEIRTSSANKRLS